MLRARDAHPSAPPENDFDAEIKEPDTEQEATSKSEAEMDPHHGED